MIISLNSALVPEDPAMLQRRNTKREDMSSFIEFAVADSVKSITIDKQQRRRYSNLSIMKELRQHDMYSKFGLLNSLSSGYSCHYGIVMQPQDLWYLILSQVAEAISQSPEKYRDLFTSSDKKELIKVQQDHPTDINVGRLIEQLKLRLPGGEKFANLFLPNLSTHDEYSELACAAAFLTSAKQYYDYGMFCCGIPAIDLRGTTEDWLTLSMNAQELQLVCAETPLAEYFARVSMVLRAIPVSLTITDDPGIAEFWCDIFRQQNVGSGGDLIIDGWIKKLYLKDESNALLKSFHNTISIFPYVNLDTGEKFAMAHGALGANIVNETFIQTRYDYMTFKINE